MVSVFRRAGMLLWLLSLTVFFAVTAYYIINHHVVPLSRDQWHMYHSLFEQGVWQTSISTVSGHRHILAFLLYAMDMTFFAGKNNFLLLVDWLLNGLLMVILCRQVWVCIADKRSRFLLCGWIVVLLVWLLNIALLGWGFNGINNYMAIVSIVLSLFFLHRAVHESDHSLRDSLLAVMLGGLATFSFGNGVLVWPISVLSLFLWRAPRQFYSVYVAATVLFVSGYFLLPGGEVAGQTLLWPGVNVLRFPVQVMGGPLYHLLRAWRVLPEVWLTGVATAAGILVAVASLHRLLLLLRWRPALDRLDAVLVALICIGFGSVIMLTMARVEGVLDGRVDRFQIFALLVWVGLSVLLYRCATVSGKKIWQCVFVLFPLLAMPAQLDWGARLAEYRQRVEISLLSYQVYLPVASDAEKALHWNWQGKLADLLYVLEHIRHEHKNVFATGAADWLGKSLPATDLLPVCSVVLQKQQLIATEDLLNIQEIPGSEAYRRPTTAKANTGDAVGMRWWLTVESMHWDYGLIADQTHTVRGLLLPLQRNRLPRFASVREGNFPDVDDTVANAYGVTRTDGSINTEQHAVVLMRNKQPLCLTKLP
jgi:hypothetical protein